MYKLLLCWRYLRTRYIALASIVSVTLGVATMIVVNAVMEGFTHEMRDRIHGILSDLVVTVVKTDPAARQITFRDLLTHRSGLTYGDLHAGPIGKAYAEALGGAIDTDVSPDDWIARLAALPLIVVVGAWLLGDANRGSYLAASPAGGT